jgi:uncharacterized protein (DUF2225 family)
LNGFAVTEFRRGEPLFVKGNPAREMYFIVTGTVELVDGHTVEKLSTGGVVGAVEFLRQEPYKTSALCVNDTSVLVLNEENLPEFFQRQPQLGFILLKAVAAYIPSSVERRGQAQAAPQRQLHQSLRELLPPGHPQSDAQRPESDGEFLYIKTVQCPVCQASFSTHSIRESRLMTERICPDFRVINGGFEPLWYHAWVCPECLYAQPANQFEQISPTIAGKIRGQQQRYPLKGDFQFSASRTLQEVFLSYFLVLRTLEFMGAPAVQFGNTWLKLLWLYEDMGEQNWAQQAAEKALAYFEEAIVSGRRSDEGDQRLFLIMAELCLRLGKRDEALRYLWEVLSIKGGSERYRRQASDRIQDIRSAIQ